MKIKAIRKKSWFIVFAVLFFTGCSIFPDGTVDNVESTKQILIDNSKHINMQLNNHIKVDADVHMSDETGWKQFKTTYRMPDEKSTNERAALFTQGNEIINVEKIEETGGGMCINIVMEVHLVIVHIVIIVQKMQIKDIIIFILMKSMVHQKIIFR